MKQIDIVFEANAEEFLDGLPLDAKKKFFTFFDKTKTGFKGNWFKKLKGTDDLWEFRVLYQNNHYRLLAFWDTRGAVETLIICTEGFLKKTGKTPKRLISNAETIKREHFSG